MINSQADDSKIDVSVVLPCYNEEAGVVVCVRKIKEVFAQQGIKGEIVVVDNNSIDQTAKAAQSEGAKVVTQPIQGYGAAYLKGLSQSQGEFIIIGDADASYDFADIPKFIAKLREGYELVLGSRFRGQMAKGAMTWSHRFIGNPVLSFLFRLFFHNNLSDIHTGMRGFTRAAYQKMKLSCMGMEFASEMIFSALQKKLKIEEIPINYYPRIGKSKLHPFRDAWRHFRFMLLFSPDTLFLFPGFFLLCFGLLIAVFLAQKSFLFLGHKWDIHALVLGSLLCLSGFQVLSLGVYAKLFAIREKYLCEDDFISFLNRNFRLEFGILTGGMFFLAGFTMNVLIFIEWWSSYFGPLQRMREAVLAMTLMVLGIQIIFSSFFMSLLAMKK